jgi:hypothetical protein
MDKSKETIKFWKSYVDNLFATIRGDSDPEEI